MIVKTMLALALATPSPVSGDIPIAPGVMFRTFQTTTARGPVMGRILEIDLRRARVGLLRPPDIAARLPVSAMVNARHGIAGVNGDFFNISETHPGVPPTGSSVGPEIADGTDLKAAVPDGQRFGPAMAPGDSTEDVIGVDRDHTGRLARLHLTGTIRIGHHHLPVRALNQYAIAVGGIGAYTSAWGAMSRARAVCGTDTVRTAPCSTDTAEAAVRRGTVTQIGNTIGAGPIAPDTTVLVGREQGADELRTLHVGQRVRVRYHLTARKRFRFAVGGAPILRDGKPLAGLDPLVAAPRTAAGVSANGHHMYLIVLDGKAENSGGLTIAELADLLKQTGATNGINLDGGGSSTIAVRLPGEPTATVRNTPADGTERPVANGIGIF